MIGFECSTGSESNSLVYIGPTTYSNSILRHLLDLLSTEDSNLVKVSYAVNLFD